MASLDEIIMFGLNIDEERIGERRPPDDAFQLSNKKFVKNYRLRKSQVLHLIELITPFMSTPQRSTMLDVRQKVLIALNFFATGSYQNSVGGNLMARVSQATVSKCITEVVMALNNPSIFGEWVRFPRNFRELETISRRFYNLYGLPGVVGCIDCTHVAIYPPPNNEAYEEFSYVNRKGYHSINTQLICDADLLILNVNALFPGGTHDSFIWNQSAVLPVMRTISSMSNGSYYLIGDSGYALRPWLHTPIPEPQTPREERYNEAFKKARSTIERCNGVLKSRFRCLLKHRVLHYLPEKAIKIINACCVLHNMCIKENTELLESEEQANIDYGLYNYEPTQYRPNADLRAAEYHRNMIVNNYF